jgi:hypothetical protein
LELSLTRERSYNGATLGALKVNGSFECYTLEDEVREPVYFSAHVQTRDEWVRSWKVPGKTAIPRGRYPVVIDRSARFGRDMLHILDVHGFEGIRIHAGNKAEDTEGCVLVGQEKAGNLIFKSKDALAVLFDKVKTALKTEKVFITIA